MTPFTAPIKAVTGVAKGVGGLVSKAAPAISSIAGMVGQAATVGSMFMPELLPVVGIADAVAAGAGIAG